MFKLDDPLTHATAIELSGMLARREISSEELVRAHVDRIITLDGRVSAFVELLRGLALQEAKKTDDARARGETLGPLAGLPVSVKENLDMVGRASTLGIIARKGKLAQRDAAIVLALRRAGAIIVGRTNVPQLLLSHETRNPVFGVTNNPHSAKHTPGGSSGGEAAAIASGFSTLGVGTDIGGSIRVPAHFCGIAGLKPTLDRWSNRGSNGALVGQEVVRSQTGPMARTVSDLAFFFGAIDPLAMAVDDPLVAPVPVRDLARIDVRKLRVGFFVDDGLIKPSLSVQHAIHQSVKALEGAGVEVVPFVAPAIRDAVGCYLAALASDGGKTAFRQLEGTTIESTLEPLRRAAALSPTVRAGLCRALMALGQERVAWVLSLGGEKAIDELWQITKRARDYRLLLIEAMQKLGVSAILCPAHATAALPHGKGGQFLLAGSYSMLFNLVQFPAGVVPVGRVLESEARRDPTGTDDRFERIAREVDSQSAGLPIGVQLAAPPFHDEEVLALMLTLERALAGSDRPKVPRAPA